MSLVDCIIIDAADLTHHTVTISGIAEDLARLRDACALAIATGRAEVGDVLGAERVVVVCEPKP